VTAPHEQLFTTWLTRHKNLIYKVVNAYAVSSDDQADLFQEIVLQLWLSVPHFQGRARETTWIYRVALNTALVWKRTQRRKNKKLTINLPKLNEIADANDPPGACLATRELIDTVYQAIRTLPEPDKSIILLHLDGLTYNEMADVLGISPTNVGVRLTRARKKLAPLLKDLIDDL